MTQGIMVFMEQRNGSVKKTSLEALSAARKLADSLNEGVMAVCVGFEDESVPLAQYGADQIIIAKHDLLLSYSTEGYASTAIQVAKKFAPRAILGTASATGRDFLPRVASGLGVGLAQDCVGAEITDDKQFEFTRPIYAGKAFARIRATMEPAMATLRPNVFSAAAPDSSRSAQKEAFTPDLAPEKIKARVSAVESAAGQKMELTEANAIASGGRGVKASENFSIIQDLADALNGAMGASRAAVDAGWIEHQHQVGQTGKTVSPTLYVACGISGAIQHLAGMSSSKYIVAINKDPEAPIFKLADYGIVGDLFTVVPALTEEIKKLKS
jgi:electron transfer flavoprotein alpha subunit